MTNLVFHLGDMKTGSTAIQTALSSKRWKCDSVNLLYPHGNRVSHITFAQSLSGRVDPSRTEKLAREILNEVEANPKADVAVVSAEHFENVDPKVLKRTIETYFPGYLAGARFIAYVRPHADRFPSTYAERVKTGMYVGTLEELQHSLHDRETYVYTPRFLSWRETFGDAFELRPMIRDHLFRNDVVADFLQFALQTEDFTLSETPDANESLSLENLAIVRQLHVKLNGGKNKGAPYQSTVGRALARMMNDSKYQNGTKVRIHKSLAEEVRLQYADDAAALDAAFFKGTPMTDALNGAPAKAVDTAQSVRIEDHFTDREQYLINILLDQTMELISADPDYLARKLRVGHRTNVIAKDDGDTVTVRQRRSPKARKAAAAAAEQATDGRGKPGKRAGAGRATGKAEGAGRPEGARAGAGKAGAGKAGGGRPGGGKPGAGKAGPKAGGPRAGGPKAGLRPGRANAGKQAADSDE
jgi:hypothetical protein